MGKIVNINTVQQCNKIAGEKTLHPLVSVIDLSKINREEFYTLQVGFYCIVLKEYTCQHFAFGRKECDYSDGTIVFLSPGKIINMERNHDVEISGGRMLAFHPDLLTGMCLGMHIEEYTFMNYSNDEALHISIREKKIFMRCLENINEELQRSIDKYSRVLVTKEIDLLLGYCARFYERQFIIRCEENKELIRRADKIINDYFLNNKVKSKGLPSAKYCAELLDMSSAYFTELLKQETGYTVSEYVQSKRMEIAKKWLTQSDKSIPVIATSLGYSSPEYFKQLFEKLIGVTPKDFRLPN